MKSTSAPIIAILGPTASGKTAYAIDIAKRLNGAIISADSRQVYAGMNIGTAKPIDAFANTPHDAMTPDIIDSVPHYLLNIATIDQTYTLSDWLADTTTARTAIRASGKTPIIAGGTMLYIDALLDGYDIPNIQPNQEYRNRLEQESPEVLYKQLRERDPASCEFIEPHNTRRIIRALEVIETTGKKFSDLRKAQPQYVSQRIGLCPSTGSGQIAWSNLKSNIEQRSRDMISQGIVDEAVALRKKHPTSPLLQTINYKQALMLADGELTEEEAIAQMSQATLRYAHRQMSWWNRRKDIGWICT